MASFTIFNILWTLLLGGFSYVVSSKLVNELIINMNTFIDNGWLTSKFITYWDFVIGGFQALPFIITLGVIFWALVRANERRTEGIV